MRKLIPLALFATAACNQERPRLILPPADKLQATPVPVPPTDATDENVARFIAAQDAALRSCNATVNWLAAWFREAGK